jgi:hypothetical protein
VLHDIVRECGGTTREACVAIEEQFPSNCGARALHLNAMFLVFVQGDQNVNDYSRKMKGMADALRDLGEPVSDRTFVLNILQGLNNWYDHLKTFLKRVVPFPSFHDVCNDLLLEEITIGVEAASDYTTTFAIIGRQQSRPPPSSAPPDTSLEGLHPPTPSGGGGGGSHLRRNNHCPRSSRTRPGKGP